MVHVSASGAVAYDTHRNTPADTETGRQERGCQETG